MFSAGNRNGGRGGTVTVAQRAFWNCPGELLRLPLRPPSWRRLLVQRTLAYSTDVHQGIRLFKGTVPRSAGLHVWVSRNSTRAGLRPSMQTIRAKYLIVVVGSALMGVASLSLPG